MRIALWGAFDVEDVEHHATRWVVEQGLRERLGRCEVAAFSPLGALRPLALDRGRPARALPPPSPDALAELAGGVDCVLVCGGDTLVGPERASALWGDGAAAAAAMIDGLGPDLETGCPVIWAGVAMDSAPDPVTTGRIAAAADRRRPITVLDDHSRRLLAEAGVDGDIAVVPPYALALPCRFEPSLLRRRIELLQTAGWTWPPGAAITVSGNRGLLGAVRPIAAALMALVEKATVRVQLVSTGSLNGEDKFADALEEALDGRCRRLPGTATPEDLVAAIAGSAGFVGPPGVGLWFATALGVPATSPAVEEDHDDGLLAELGVCRPPVVDLQAPVASLAGRHPDPHASAAARKRVERQLDTLAALALAATCRRTRPSRPHGKDLGLTAEELLDSLRRAHQARGLQLLAERRAFQAEKDAAIAELRAAIAAARDDADRLRSELAAARAANDQMVASRTWRYTQPLRDGLARIREMRR